jgi:hypothetical protein
MEKYPTGMCNQRWLIAARSRTSGFFPHYGVADGHPDPRTLKRFSIPQVRRAQFRRPGHTATPYIRDTKAR